MPFTVTIHEARRIVEVVYPAEPTSLDVAEYILRIKRVMDSIEAPWYCLVDQRPLRSMSQKLMSQVRDMNHYAVMKGMVRSARVVHGPLGTLQTQQMAANAGAEVRAFSTREEALAWLTTGR